MSVLDVIRNRGPVAEANNVVARLSEDLYAERNMVEVLREGMADLELALEDQGWDRLTDQFGDELSRPALLKAAKICRVSAVANPLIKRGLNVRQSYVFGGGIDISAIDKKVDEILQKFMTDVSNMRSMFGSQAQEELERALGTDGNVFLAHFTTKKTGRVEVRSFPFDEITDILRNPEDRDEPWYYERRWVETGFDNLGNTRKTIKVAYYPDLHYRPSPAQRLKAIDGHPVIWDAPIWHLSVNRLDGWKFGIGDSFAAVSWARAYKEFLEDWSLLVKALSRFAWRFKHKRSGVAQKMRDKLAGVQTVDPNTGRPLAGGALVSDQDGDMEAIPKTGAVIDSTSGKPLAAMVASALEISLVVLITDPGATGARAVAETLDAPTIRAMEKRRELWKETFTASLNYVIDAAVRAGKLSGTELFDLELRKFVTTLKGDDKKLRMLDISFPELESEAVKDRVESIVAADGKIPDEIIARLLLQALGVDDVEEIIEGMKDENGNFKAPGLADTLAAVRAFRKSKPPDQDDPAQDALEDPDAVEED